MDRARLELNPIPPAAIDADLPLCLTLIEYDGGPIVAAFWWDDAPLHEIGARLAAEDGTLGDAPLSPVEGDELPEVGWWWWRVGEEAPWPHDPRVNVAAVHGVGNLGTPADMAQLVRDELGDDPEPSWSREQSIEMVVRRLPFWGVGEDTAAVLADDPTIGTGSVVVELPDEDQP
jgi:hypothetical protein